MKGNAVGQSLRHSLISRRPDKGEYPALRDVHLSPGHIGVFYHQIFRLRKVPKYYFNIFWPNSLSNFIFLISFNNIGKLSRNLLKCRQNIYSVLYN